MGLFLLEDLSYFPLPGFLAGDFNINSGLRTFHTMPPLPPRIQPRISGPTPIGKKYGDV
jgi:hypothetical protein